ncbi:MAG: putative phosphohistidine phosphatase, SixA [Geminicoccaceae bacterium]|nr:putative phosphohistidine phosphatase, SixA [Geminicoccaceae bacterium]
MRPVRFRRCLLVLLAWGLVAQPAPAPAADEAELFEALRTGRAALLLRHALAPGTGDPAEFRLDDCATQRNLSAAGREQARAIGERLRAQGIAQAEVYSSQWCRCLETARLLDLGSVTELPALNSFFGDRASADAQTAALRDFLSAGPRAAPVVLVTHQVNITALTGQGARSGEIVVVALPFEGEGSVLGRIPPLD